MGFLCIVFMLLQNVYCFSNTTTDVSISTNASILFKTQNDIAKLEDPCYSNATCEVAGTKEDRLCRCDKKCEQFNDCCIDYNKISSPFIDEEYSFKCEPLMPLQTVGIFVIGSCLNKHIDSNLTKKCENGRTLLTDVGPFVINGEDLVFRNKFCALCNNVTEFQSFDVEFPNLKMSGNLFDTLANWSKEDQINFLSRRRFQYKMVAPYSSKIRSCVVKETISDTDLCLSYSNPILVKASFKNIIYRNYFCIPPDEKAFLTCDNGLIFDKEKDPSIQSLSVMFSFRSEMIQSKDSDVTQCKVWIEKMTDEDECSHLPTYINVGTKIDFFLISNTSMTSTMLVKSAVLSLWAYEITNLTKVNGNQFIISIAENGMAARVIANVIITKRAFWHEIGLIKSKLESFKLQMNIIHGDTILITKERVLPTALVNTTGNFVARVLTDINIDFVSMETRYSENNISTSGLTIDAFCNDIVIEIGKIENDLMKMKNFNCRNQKETNSTTSFNVEGCITYACFSVSSLSLIVLFIHNRKRGMHLNTPGSNLQNIALTMLLSNTFFMLGIGITQKNVCYLIGVLLHYLWLTMFCFLSIAVLHIFINIRRMKSNTTHKATVRGKKRQLLLTGLLTPLIFVTPALLIDFFGPSYLSPGYNGSVCFPNHFPANVIFFTGPVILSLFINFVCLGQTITHICMVRYEVSQLTGSSYLKRDAVVYMRIVVMSGIFWMFGIFAAIFDLKWLNYIFILLCALQGLFVAVSNLTTARVLTKSEAVNS